MIEKEDLSTNQIGHSGEFLASSMLQRIFPAIAFPQTIAHYDILCETKSGDFVKCQVKTTNKIEVKQEESEIVEGYSHLTEEDLNADSSTPEEAKEETTDNGS